MKTLGIASFLFFLTSAGASAWVPAECSGNPPKQWAVYEEKVRKAIPSSTIYVPRPFPVKEADIIEDLKQQYFRVGKNTRRADIPKEELPFLEGLEKGTLRFQVEKIVNWTPTRAAFMNSPLPVPDSRLKRSRGEPSEVRGRPRKGSIPRRQGFSIGNRWVYARKVTPR